ncbi:MAG: ABC transporter permease subunit [Clostridia bacterium]|nr:ABC transporter permease subunit [Clostridia bacterium]
MLRNNKKQWQRLLAFAIALIVWQAAALLVDEKVFVPSPIDVAIRFVSLLGELSFFAIFFYSLGRVLIGFFAGLLLGCLLAVLAARFPLAETLLYPYMITIRSVPVASFVVLALLWLSSAMLSGFIAFLIVLPIVYNGVLVALQATDRQLNEMAQVFHVSFFDRLRCIYVPQVRPALLAAATTSIGLAWKSGIAAELFGMPDGSIGNELYHAKLYLDTPALFAWTLVIVLGSLVCEKLLTVLLRFVLGGYRK